MTQATLLGISAYLAFFYSGNLFLKKGKHVSDYYMATWLIVLSIHTLGLITPIILKFPLVRLTSPLLPIFIFTYIRSITIKSKSQTANLLYFLPYVLLMLVPHIFIHKFYTTYIFEILILFFFIPYLTGSFILIKRYKKYLKKNYSNIEYADISWLIILLAGVSFFFTSSVITEAFAPHLEMPIFSASLFIFMNITGIKAIRQSLNFIKRPIEENNEKTNDDSYANYGLKGSDAETLAHKLKQYMEKDKPYIKQEISLKDLAKAMDTYPHYITQVLSTVFDQNFYDFVNTYRVEEAKRLLKDPKMSNLTVLAIAFDCGFNSKSAFNRAFKQKTNQTPTEYRLSEN